VTKLDCNVVGLGKPLEGSKRVRGGYGANAVSQISPNGSSRGQGSSAVEDPPLKTRSERVAHAITHTNNCERVRRFLFEQTALIERNSH